MKRFDREPLEDIVYACEQVAEEQNYQTLASGGL
jgi:hypothetical protein